jgi:hypothetical protein
MIKKCLSSLCFFKFLSRHGLRGHMDASVHATKQKLALHGQTNDPHFSMFSHAAKTVAQVFWIRTQVHYLDVPDMLDSRWDGRLFQMGGYQVDRSKVRTTSGRAASPNVMSHPSCHRKFGEYLRVARPRVARQRLRIPVFEAMQTRYTRYEFFSR